MGGTNGATSEVTRHTHAAAINEQARATTRKETARARARAKENERERGGMERCVENGRVRIQLHH